jgi:hypothetical protein
MESKMIPKSLDDGVIELLAARVQFDMFKEAREFPQLRIARRTLVRDYHVVSSKSAAIIHVVLILSNNEVRPRATCRCEPVHVSLGCSAAGTALEVKNLINYVKSSSRDA